MNKKHKNDISIGENKWIIFEDIRNGQNSAIEIDSYMLDLLPMWKAIETNCVAECCGIDAYDLWRDDVLRNTENLNKVEIVAKLQLLYSEIQNIDSTVLVSNALNNYFTKDTFLKIVEHLLNVYMSA